MKVVFLGTNGWYDTATGNTICIFIETNNEYIILDAGNGFHKIDAYVTDDKPIYLFLSHFHLDHIIGLHILSKFNFSRGIHIVGQKGTGDALRTIITKPYTVPFEELPMDVRISELPAAEKELPFNVKSGPMLHSVLTLGFRFEIENKTITYCPDTGYCDKAVELAANADLLIAECAYKSGQRNDEWPHMNPEDAARLALEAGARKLALVHFDANNYRTLDERKEAEEAAKAVFADTIAVLDDTEIMI